MRVVILLQASANNDAAGSSKAIAPPSSMARPRCSCLTTWGFRHRGRRSGRWRQPTWEEAFELPRLAAFEKDSSDGVLELERVGQEAREPALHGAAAGPILRPFEEGDIAVQADGGVEPREEFQRDDEAGVVQAEVVRGVVVTGVVGALATPPPLPGSWSSPRPRLARSRHVQHPATNAVRRQTSVPRGRQATAVHETVVAQLERGQPLGGDGADKIGIPGRHFQGLPHRPGG